MRTIDFVLKESVRLPRKTLTGILYVLLGIAVFVACQTITKALHDRAKEELLRFGANIIVQPKGEPFNIYTNSIEGKMLIPEKYVKKVRTIPHGKMLIAVSPKLYHRFTIGDQSIQAVGITPDEAKAKRWWLINQNIVTHEFPQNREVLLGHYAASYLEDGATHIKLGSDVYRITGVLDETGSNDDFMAFIPLKELQSTLKAEGMVNVIEISTSCIACKDMNVNDVVDDIDEVLPDDAQVFAVKQVAEAQMGTLNKIIGFSAMIYAIVLAFCTLLLINYTSSSINERKREIGILLAMGMAPLLIQLIFVTKTIIISLIGGVLGFFLGSLISIKLGPFFAGTEISIIPSLLSTSLVVSIGFGLFSSIIPTIRLSKLDPVVALREV